MNKILWLISLLTASILFLVSILTKDISCSLISLILVLLLDKYKPIRFHNKKMKSRYYNENKGR